MHTTRNPGLYRTVVLHIPRSDRQEHRNPAASMPPSHAHGDSDDATALSKTCRVFVCMLSHASVHMLQPASSVGSANPQHLNAGSPPQHLRSTRSL